MLKPGKKWPRYFAIIVALVMITETIAFTLTGYAKNDTDAAYELNNEDKTTVSEISNVTGVKAEEITKLRKEGRTWNEILELIKNNPGYKAEGDDIKRKDTLANNGMEEDTLNKLKEEGYEEEQIIEARTIVERVMFQLDEITNTQAAMPSLPEAGASIDENKDNMSSYTALTGKINLSEAVYLILKLQQELGSMQAVLDEYLCSLQLGIDLNQYLSNKEEYQRLKQQKTAELAAQELITSADIEEKMLDTLQNMNKRDMGVPEIKADGPSLSDTVMESPLPDVQAPAAQDIKPQNPAEAILQEIESIKTTVSGGMGGSEDE
ncbi:MAG: hypothetical protein APF77_18330 [Clostridia bacterium BRH_c25]|nr:MAG: hypothetical protein APF77_18330 [Clostridia bacterium BRH_c25]